MSTSSIIVMITGMLIIWGGLTASIINAIRKNEKTEH
ncbi:hypothetical protein HNQ35_000508 [Cerasibacillus quisquiliarum]|nr:methionine/alanine import family NSS transporter small subunit [Cerasibacillus quisquiliarum]MBB5145319.1 hypothetical protein [Cerasibacillus quisquiliarum]